MDNENKVFEELEKLIEKKSLEVYGRKWKSDKELLGITDLVMYDLYVKAQRNEEDFRKLLEAIMEGAE